MGRFTIIPAIERLIQQSNQLDLVTNNSQFRICICTGNSLSQTEQGGTAADDVILAEVPVHAVVAAVAFHVIVTVEIGSSFICIIRIFRIQQIIVLFHIKEQLVVVVLCSEIGIQNLIRNRKRGVGGL